MNTVNGYGSPRYRPNLGESSPISPKRPRTILITIDGTDHHHRIENLSDTDLNAARNKKTESVTMVSVIIPAYNAEKTIAETLGSAVVQDYENLEIIVVDDGSSDLTKHIVQETANADPRVAFLEQSNQGVAAARNNGIGASRGSYLAFLDADDIWHPEKISRQLRYLLEHGTDKTCVYSPRRTIDAESRVMFTNEPPLLEGNLFDALCMENFIGLSNSVLCERLTIANVGKFDIRFFEQNAQGCEDLEFSLRLANQFEIACCPEFLVGYRRTEMSMSDSAEKMLRSAQFAQEILQPKLQNFSPKKFRTNISMKLWECGVEKLRRGRFLAGLLFIGRSFLKTPARTTLYSIETIFRRLPIRRVARFKTAKSPNRRSFYSLSTNEGEFIPMLWYQRKKVREFRSKMRTQNHRRFSEDSEYSGAKTNG